MIVLIPQRRGSLEASPRGPFGLSALIRFMLLLDFFGFPLGTRATYCVVGGGWGVFLRNIKKKQLFFLNKSPQQDSNSLTILRGQRPTIPPSLFH